ncbi:hypothetical protein J4440_05025 [Candidatus Woesearchaeota archaeon]|nr:hypothetical protein [Candidatus Woesearchaeota archaeon]
MGIHIIARGNFAFEDKVYLMNRMNYLWVPTFAGHIARDNEINNKKAYQVIEEKINSSGYKGSYKFIIDKDCLIMNHSNFHKGRDCHITLDLFGILENEPQIIEGAFELFDLNRLYSENNSGRLESSVLTNSINALKYAEKYFKK